MHAAVSLTVTPITWNIIGLDSNNVNVGPNHFPIGARVCNTGGTAATNVTATFVWDTTPVPNYINSRSGTNTTLSVASLAASGCTDFYFEVEVTRDSAAYNTTRRYHIEVTSTETGATTFSTPTPRELFVEHLVSQSRNGITSVEYGTSLGSLATVAAGGTMTLVVGNTYYIKMTGFTATQGYEQIEYFVNFPNTIFQVLSVSSTFSADTSTTVGPSPIDKLYGDNCVWENDPNSLNYRACNSEGKTGGNITVTYQVKILQVPSAPLVNPEPLSTLIYDFSGSSFHYNSDYGISTRYAYIVNPSITKAFSPKTINPNGTSTLTFTITNPGADPITGVNFTDSLPTNVTISSTTVTYTGCGSSPSPASGSLTIGQTALSFSNIEVNGYSTCTIAVSVTSSTNGTYNNTSGNLYINTSTNTGSSAADSLVVSSTPAAPTSCTTKTTMATWTLSNYTASTSTNNGPFSASSQQSDVSTASGTYNTITGSSSGIADPTTYPSASWGSNLEPSSNADGNDGNSWGINGAWLSSNPSFPITATTPSFQFAVDASSYGGIGITSSYNLQGNWSNSGNWYVLSSTDGSTWSSANSGAWNKEDKWQTTTHNTPITATTTSTGISTMYFKVFAAGAQYGGNPSVTTGTLYLDDITITGCQRPDPPTLSKSFASSSIALGNATTLTFTVTNPNASSSLSGVSFSDTLPTGLVINSPNGLTSPTCTSGTLTGQTITATASSTLITMTGGTLSAGATNCSFSVSVKGNTAGSYTNTSGSITSTDSGANTTASGYGTASLAVVAPPVIAKSFGSTNVITGSTTPITFTVSNPNTATALTGVVFTDTVPSGLDVVPTTLSNACGAGSSVVASNANPDTIILSGGSIAASSTCAFQITITGTTAGVYTNTVTASSTNGGTGNTASATVLVRAATPAVSLLKQVSNTNTAPIPWSSFTTVTGGSNVYYKFTVENVGDVALSSVDVTDPETAIDNLINTCSWADGDGTSLTAPFTLPVADAADNQLATCTVGPVTAASSGPHSNTATASGTNGSTVTDTSTAIYGIRPSISKSFAASSIVSGGNTNLTVTITNTNTSPITTTATLTDTFPSGMTINTAGNTGTCSGVTATAGAGSFTIASGTSIPAGGCTVIVNVTSSTLGTATNTISAGALQTYYGSNASAATASLDVTSNVAPVNTVPGTQTVTSGTQTAISGVSVTDANGNLSTTQLTVTAGSLNVTLSGGVTISAGSNDSSSLTLSGTESAIQTVLGTLKFTGTANTTVTMLSTDALGLTDTDTFNINVNNPPVNTVPGTQTVTSGTQTAIGGVSVTDPNGNLSTTQLTVTAGSLNVTLSGGVTISAGSNDSSSLTLSGTESAIQTVLGTLKFTGTANTTLTVLSTDALGLTDTDTFNINVGVGGGNTPTAVNDSATTTPGTPVTISVLTNDSFGTDGASTSSPITITVSPTKGTALVNTNGTAIQSDDRIVYTPNNSATGTDTLTYQICDATPDCTTATVTITINANSTPTANNDIGSVAAGSSTTINVTSNDNFGSDGPSTGTITITTNGTKGTATVNDNGTPNDPSDDKISYTANAGSSGTDTVTYRICDSTGDCTTATVTITITSNNTPTAVNDTATVNVSSSTTINVLSNDNFGADGPNSSAITITTNPTKGTATVNNNGTPSDPTDDRIVYSANNNVSGTDTLTYQICDATPDCTTATATITITTPDLKIGINDPSQGSFQVGVDKIYALNVTNIGDGSTTGTITVTDTLPAGVTINSVSGTNWSCSTVGQTITCIYTGGAATSGATLPSINVSIKPTTTGSFSHTPTVSTPNDNNAPNNSVTHTLNVVTTTAPDLRIQKTHLGTDFTVGINGTFVMTITNVGTATMSAGETITVVENLPTGLTMVSASREWSCTVASPHVCTHTLAQPMAIGGEMNLIIVVSPTTTGSKINAVSVSAPSDTNSANNNATDTVNVNAANTLVDLSISKTHSGTFTAGANGTFTITLTNSGATTVAAGQTINVTDFLPSRFNYVSSSNPTCALATPQINCTVTLGAALASGQSTSFTVTVTPTTPGTYYAPANLSYGADTNPLNNSAMDTVSIGASPNPDLAITQYLTTNLLENTNGTITLSVKNVGASQTSGGIVVTNTLPAGLTFVSGSGTNWTCSAVGQVVTCNYDVVAGGAVAVGGSMPTITLNVSVASGTAGTLSNTAVVSTIGDTNTTNNSSTLSVTVTATATVDIAIVETVPSHYIPIDEPYSAWTLTVRNYGTLSYGGYIGVADPSTNDIEEMMASPEILLEYTPFTYYDPTYDPFYDPFYIPPPDSCYDPYLAYSNTTCWGNFIYGLRQNTRSVQRGYVSRGSLDPRQSGITPLEAYRRLLQLANRDWSVSNSGGTMQFTLVNNALLPLAPGAALPIIVVPFQLTTNNIGTVVNNPVSVNIPAGDGTPGNNVSNEWIVTSPPVNQLAPGVVAPAAATGGTTGGSSTGTTQITATPSSTSSSGLPSTIPATGEGPGTNEWVTMIVLWIVAAITPSIVLRVMRKRRMK